MSDFDAGETESFAELDRLIALSKFVANAKNIELRARALAKLNRHIREAEGKLAALTAQAEQREAALAERAAALEAREAALDARMTEFENSLNEARDNLAAYYSAIAEQDRLIRYRVLNSADLLGGYNPQLQDLPTWPQLRRLVVGLPDDPPPPERDVVSHPRIDALSDMFSDPNADRHGNAFLGTLSRNVSHRTPHE
jgi:hypothetical protein